MEESFRRRLPKYWRLPRNYDGTRPTTRSLGELLPVVLAKVGEAYSERPDMVLAAWPEIVGEKIAPLTEAVSLSEGILVVKVKNSTLHSLLAGRDKGKILGRLQKQFPQAAIKRIVFRIG